jgi:NitT/TauT family transport system substrate-binding protein
VYQELDAAPVTTVQLALNWFPEAEHGGFYTAQVEGFFASRFVAVEILGGGPDAPVIQRVASGQVAFGVTNADGVINARIAGADVVALMAPYQINPRCIVVHENSGFTSIDQLANITLGLSQRPAFSHFLRWKYDFPGVTFVPYDGSVTPLVTNQEFALQGYLFSEPVIARRLGAVVRALMVADTGFNPYASVLITSERVIEQYPELVRAMTEASVQGWLHYLKDPDVTNARIHQLNPQLDMEILEEGARQSVPLVLDSTARARGLGHMELSRWKQLLEQMVACGIIAEVNDLDVSKAFSTDFLPAPNPMRSLK